jgi:NitT/TauT family transport system substrate-binding protein
MINKKIKIAILTSALLLVLITGFLWQGGFLGQRGPREKLTIGVSHSMLNGLVWIAQSQGFNKEQELEITLKTYQAGKEAMQDLTSGRLDLACAAEFALVGEILAGHTNLRCLAALAAGEIEDLIARRDRGISRPEDLPGKTIGVPKGTIAEFFLGRFLTFNQIALKDVTIVNVKPLDLVDDLAAGKVDAILAWKELTQELVKKVGNNAVIWPAQGGQDHYWLLVAPVEIVKQKSPALEKLVKALARADDFVNKKPEAAREIMTQWLKVPLIDVPTARPHIRYELFLDQGLLLAMEDQARWLISNKLTDRKQVPNFLDYLDAEALLKIDPKGVRLIIPGKEAAKP